MAMLGNSSLNFASRPQSLEAVADYFIDVD
jgi:hypothetical protein